jgi:DNA-binding NarL/FixJ family response regulator
MQVAPTTAWSNPALPMNLNRRGQILRLSRKGKSVAEIASDLHVAQGEVELLLKVHDFGQKTATLDN